MADGDVAAQYGFTVVQSTADIRLGYNDINRGADFAAGLAGPVNGVVVLASGSSNVYAAPLLRRVKNRVVCQFGISRSDLGSAGITFMTLPSGFRPTQPIPHPVAYGDTAGTVIVGTDGGVQTRGAFSRSQVTGVLVFDVA